MPVKESFEEVYEKHFSEIYNFVYSQLLHREQAEDIVSDVFMKAMSSYDRYDPSKASVRTWLTHIARNTLIDQYRRKGNKGNVSLDDEESGVIEPSFEDEYGIFHEAQEKEVYNILSKLSEAERELLGMIYFQNMKNEEVAAVLGINAKAVSARHHRLLQKCRDLEKGLDISDFV